MAKTFDTNATIATWAQLVEAQSAGAQWCSAGFTTDNKAGYPTQSAMEGCGMSVGVVNYNIDGSTKLNVNVYGINPIKSYANCSNNKVCVLPFNPTKWSRWDTTI